MIWWIILLTLILSPIVLIGFLYVWNVWLKFKNKNYWQLKGVTTVPELKVRKSFVKRILNPATVMEVDSLLITECKNKNVKIMGGHELSTPFLYCIDLDLIKRVLIKDFDSFVNRRKLPFEGTDPHLTQMLFNMEGNEWKGLRTKMSPAFTTGKIKKMFKIFDLSSKALVKYLESEISKSDTGNFDLCVGYGKYTMDVIAAAAFGIDGKIFQEENSIFEKMGQKYRFKITLPLILKFLATLLMPKVVKRLGITFMDAEADRFFTNVVKSVIKDREATGSRREDFLQLMMEIRDGKLVKVDENELDTFEKDALLNIQQEEKLKEKALLDDEIIVAQSILFIMAGFDTTQSSLLFAAYQLALCPEVQEKLFQEVNSVFENGDGELTYEAVNEMQYMDKFICETLRMFPPVARTERRCNQPYTLPETNITLDKDTLFSIPVYAIHHDEDNFPDPEKFDPERFSAENKAKRNPYTFLPFGHGPRNCIGMRFALMEVKVVLAHFVLNFIAEPCEKTLIPMKFNTEASTKPLGGMWLNLRKR